VAECQIDVLNTRYVDDIDSTDKERNFSAAQTPGSWFLISFKA
jgi:hypothetical protein